VAEPKFEKDLEKLEGIVEALEEGGLPLDQSLKKFEEGIALAKRCEKALTSAEKKIEVLTKNAEGKLSAKPFGDEGDTDAEDDTESEDDDEETEEELLF
jgi:exodeoxyribonuclease VII small subunit